MPAADIKEAVAFCKNLGIRHEIIKTDPFSIPEIAANTPERCYLCKKLVFSAFLDFARNNNIHIVCDGSNADDTADYRPGMKALKELGVRSPLLDCGLHKVEIRQLLHDLGLSCVRVRVHSGAGYLMARIEIMPSEMPFFLKSGLKFMHNLKKQAFHIRHWI